LVLIPYVEIRVGIGNLPPTSGLLHFHTDRWGERAAVSSELLKQCAGHLTSVELIGELQPNAEQQFFQSGREQLADRCRKLGTAGDRTGARLAADEVAGKFIKLKRHRRGREGRIRQLDEAKLRLRRKNDREKQARILAANVAIHRQPAVQ